jgi:hypothetical protein
LSDSLTTSPSLSRDVDCDDSDRLITPSLLPTASMFANLVVDPSPSFRSPALPKGTSVAIRPSPIGAHYGFGKNHHQQHNTRQPDAQYARGYPAVWCGELEIASDERLDRKD